MTYALLSEKVFLDHVNEKIYRRSVKGGKISVHNIVLETSSEFKSLADFTYSEDNMVKSLFDDIGHRANLYSALEPIIWHSFGRSNYEIPRSVLRTALDLIVLHPELIKSHTVQAKVIVRKAIQERWSIKHPDRDLVSELEWITHKAIVRGVMAANLMEEAIRLNAVYTQMGLPCGQSRRIQPSDSFYSIGHDKMVAAVRIFLDEIKYWPRVSTITDVLNIRSNRSFKEFRSVLQSWVQAITAGSVDDERKLRKEIAEANRGLRSAVACSTAGRWFTYLGLPLVFVDQYVVPYFGALASIAGFALQAYSDWQSYKYKWIRIGRST
jgi:hypothetical protein